MSTDNLLQAFESAQSELVLQASDLSLRTVATMVKSGAIDVAPAFQRRERWSAAKQAALIESFLLNIPVPPIYLAEDKLGIYSVIDGKQRITAITSFLTDQLELRYLHRLPDASGLRFSALPRPVQHALEFRPLRSVTLLRQSHPELKYEVFHRLNTGGEILNPQEIRNVAFRGSLNDLIYRLAEHELLLQRLKITSRKSPAYRKMLDAEYVLRFLTLTETWRGFPGSLAETMNAFMYHHRDPNPDRLQYYRRRFTRALETAHLLWGQATFKRPEGNGWRDQTLAGMYDAQMIAIDELDDEQLFRLKDEHRKVLQATRRLFEDPQFDAAVRQATNTPSRIVYRVERMIETMRGLVGS